MATLEITTILIGLMVFALILTDHWEWHRILVAGTVIVWAARLGAYFAPS